jgi:hypothetical protein
MGKGFLKFKRKLRVGAVIRAAALGLSVGALVFAALWLLDKLQAEEADLIFYALCGGAAAAVGGILTCSLLFPSKRRVARRVDKQLSLGEKTQTMLAFRKDRSEMAVLQREDTDRILRETPRRRVKGVCAWVFILLPVMAALTLTGTAMIPAKQPPEPPPVVENNFTITPWQTQALKDLIDQVKTSDMEEEPKEATVKQLESLLVKLGSIKKEPAMKEAVITCIEGIHKAVSEHNTYDTLAQVMFKSPADSVQDLGGAVNSLQALLVGDWMKNAQEQLLAGEQTPSALAAGITQALTLSGISPENEVHIALLAFTVELAALTELSEDTLAPVMAAAEQSLNAALFLQATNEEVEDDTIYSLLSIFGMKPSEVPEHIFNNPDDPRAEDDYDEQDDIDHINSGGLGTGEMIFGSDDIIFDPNRGEYVPYGEVIKDYYARITELLVDGNLSPELEEALNDYFAILFNGSVNKENK